MPIVVVQRFAPGILRGAINGIDRSTAHSEFIHVRLAHQDTSLVHQSLVDGAIIRWSEIGQHLRGTSRSDMFGAEIILYRYRDSIQKRMRFSTDVSLMAFK